MGSQSNGADLMKKRIVSLASELMARGHGELSSRNLTRELGLSTKVIYTHFGSMAGVTAAVFQLYFDQIADSLEESDPSDRPAVERLEAIAKAYRKWALANPELFDLLYGLAAARLMPLEKDRVNASRSLDVFSRVFTKDGDDAAKARQRAYLIWSAIHGPVALEVSGWFLDDLYFTHALEEFLRSYALSQ